MIGKRAAQGILFALLCGTLIVAGCSGKKSRPTAKVSGRITFNGKPLDNVSVYFQPVGAAGEKESGIGSGSITDSDGRFVLKFSDSDRPGALVGEHRVTFSDKAADDEDVDGGDIEKATKRSRIPKAWAAGTTFKVESDGTDSADFDLAKPPDAK